jgi:non-heme chloroperoxidase
MMGGDERHYDCIKAFSETDLTEDLKAIDVPVLIMHGDDDQIVPIADSALLRPNRSRMAHSKCTRACPTACALRIPTSSIRTFSPSF